jgi:HSP90 family molecular chaperone
MSLKELLDNLFNGTPNAISTIVKHFEKHTQLKQICLKYSNSISLPIWISKKEEEEDDIEGSQLK